MQWTAECLEILFHRTSNGRIRLPKEQSITMATDDYGCYIIKRGENGEGNTLVVCVKMKT